MTSQEIHDARISMIDTIKENKSKYSNEVISSLSNTVALYEVAFQLAVLNEGTRSNWNDKIEDKI